MSLLQSIQQRYAAQMEERRQRYSPDPDEGLRGRRTEHRRRLKVEGDGGEAIVIEFDNEFQPSPEMKYIRGEIEKLRRRAARAYGKLMVSSNGFPNFASLRRFRILASDIAYLQTKYDDAEYRAREEFRKEREKNSRLLEAVAEKGAVPLKVQLQKIDFESERIRMRSRAASEARKREIRERRRARNEMYRRARIQRAADTIREEAEEAFVEDKIGPETFRGILGTLEGLSRANDKFEILAVAFADDILDHGQFQALRRACL